MRRIHPSLSVRSFQIHTDPKTTKKNKTSQDPRETIDFSMEFYGFMHFLHGFKSPISTKRPIHQGRRGGPAEMQRQRHLTRCGQSLAGERARGYTPQKNNFRYFRYLRYLRYFRYFRYFRYLRYLRYFRYFRYFRYYYDYH